MVSFKRCLQTKLAHGLTKEELEMLPSSFQRLGHIVIVRLKKELLKNKEIIGEAAIVCVPGTKTACLNTGKVEGEFRKPQIEYLAGEDNLVVEHKEHECKFRFDVSKLMWSMGNMNERKRMYGQVKPGEVVVDFFAGLGYWVIPICKHAQPKHVYAIDANPDAIEALRENKKINHIPEKLLTIIHGKCEEVSGPLSRTADRIIMGYLPSPEFALPAAFHTLKYEGGIIHYEGICEEGKYGPLLQEVHGHASTAGYAAELLHAQPVKSMGPRLWHYVLDLKVVPVNVDEGVFPPKRKKRKMIS